LDFFGNFQQYVVLGSLKGASDHEIAKRDRWELDLINVEIYLANFFLREVL